MKAPAGKGLIGAAARPIMLNLEKHTFLLHFLIGHALCKRPPAASSHLAHTRCKSKVRDCKPYAQKMHLILVLITGLISNVIIHENMYSPNRLVFIRTLVKLPILFWSLLLKVNSLNFIFYYLIIKIIINYYHIFSSKISGH